MHPLTDDQLRTCLVNATRRERTNATMPELDGLDAAGWDRLDLLGWRDRRAPLAAYVVLELDGDPVGLLLRAGDPGPGPRRKAVCAWCQDVVHSDVTLYATRRAGSAGRRGDTLGTLICTDFTCSRNARRTPSIEEAGANTDAARAVVVDRRVAGLRERSTRFVREVLRTA